MGMTGAPERTHGCWICFGRAAGLAVLSGLSTFYQCLKAIGYGDFVSFECGIDGDRKEAIAKSARFLEGEWKRA